MGELGYSDKLLYEAITKYSGLAIKLESMLDSIKNLWDPLHKEHDKVYARETIQLMTGEIKKRTYEYPKEDPGQLFNKITSLNEFYYLEKLLGKEEASKDYKKLFNLFLKYNTLTIKVKDKSGHFNVINYKMWKNVVKNFGESLNSKIQDGGIKITLDNGTKLRLGHLSFSKTSELQYLYDNIENAYYDIIIKLEECVKLFIKGRMPLQ